MAIIILDRENIYLPFNSVRCKYYDFVHYLKENITNGNNKVNKE